jgi:hypothetical protein
MATQISNFHKFPVVSQWFPRSQCFTSKSSSWKRCEGVRLRQADSHSCLRQGTWVDIPTESQPGFVEIGSIVISTIDMNHSIEFPIHVERPSNYFWGYRHMGGGTHSQLQNFLNSKLQVQQPKIEP